MVFSSHQKINFFDAVSDHPESQKPSLVSGGFFICIVFEVLALRTRFKKPLL